MPVVAIFNGKAPGSWIIPVQDLIPHTVLGAKHSYCKPRFTHVLKLKHLILVPLESFREHSLWSYHSDPELIGPNKYPGTSTYALCMRCIKWQASVLIGNGVSWRWTHIFLLRKQPRVTDVMQKLFSNSSNQSRNQTFNDARISLFWLERHRLPTSPTWTWNHICPKFSQFFGGPAAFEVFIHIRVIFLENSLHFFDNV